MKDLTIRGNITNFCWLPKNSFMTSNTMSAADYDNAFLSSGANNGV
jgi:hypothetical protein